MPDFYLSSRDDIELNTRPRACRLIRRVITVRGNDSVLVELSPALPGSVSRSSRGEISFVVLAPRFEGESFDADHKWPVIVYVVEPLTERPEDVQALEEGKFEIAYWGEVYPSEEAANANKFDMSSPKPH